jgi:hypothetical protein
MGGMTFRILIYGTTGEVLARIEMPVLRVLSDNETLFFPLSMGRTVFTRDGVIDRIVADTDFGEVPLAAASWGTRIWPGCAMTLFTDGGPILTVERRAAP